jgi:hypothetical protein
MRLSTLSACAISSIFAVQNLQAAFVIQVYEVGPDVVVDLSGSLDLVSGSSSGNLFEGASIDPKSGRLNVGSSAFAIDGDAYVITGPSGFSAFDVPTVADPNSISEYIALSPTNLTIFGTYTSGQSLSLQNTYSKLTLADLELTVGDSFQWFWGSEPGTEVASLEVVPEASNIALLLGFLSLTFVIVRKSLFSGHRVSS